MERRLTQVGLSQAEAGIAASAELAVLHARARGQSEGVAQAAGVAKEACSRALSLGADDVLQQQAAEAAQGARAQQIQAGSGEITAQVFAAGIGAQVVAQAQQAEFNSLATLGRIPRQGQVQGQASAGVEEGQARAAAAASRAQALIILRGNNIKVEAEAEASRITAEEALRIGRPDVSATQSVLHLFVQGPDTPRGGASAVSPAGSHASTVRPGWNTTGYLLQGGGGNSRG